MKTACFIPIKSNSERVPGKNFRVLNGRKLYEYILLHVLESDCFDDIFVDTNSNEITEYCQEMRINTIEREPWLAGNSANGNDLLCHHQTLYPNYDYYFQLFATAPYLQAKSIKKCADGLLGSEYYDSCFTAISHHGFYWLNNLPVNYRPGILPRSQDMSPLIEETTGMYGITSKALTQYKSRIGRKPYVCEVSKFEAIDINTEEDLKIAEYIGKMYWNYVDN